MNNWKEKKILNSIPFGEKSYKKGKVDLWKIIVDLIIVLIMILIVKARIVDVMSVLHWQFWYSLSFHHWDLLSSGDGFSVRNNRDRK